MVRSTRSGPETWIRAHLVNGVVQGPYLSIFYQPMVIAAGPRIVSSTEGPASLVDAENGEVSFTVTFDRPIDPPSLGGYTTIPDVHPRGCPGLLS